MDMSANIPRKMRIAIRINSFVYMQRITCLIICFWFNGNVCSQKPVNRTAIDTVSVKEMVAYFNKGKQPSRPLNYYDAIESVCEANIAKLVVSPVLIKNLDMPATNFHAIWENYYSQLVLKKILPIGMSEARAEEVFSMLLKKYGGSREKGVFASWFTGTLNALICPYNLYGEWVSREKTILTVDRGYITSVDPCGIPRGNLHNCGNGVHINDGCWNRDLPEIKCLEKFIRDNYDPVFTFFQKDYSLLLFTDLSGKSYVHILRPEKMGWFDRRVVSELERTINELPVGSFRYLETLDGRIFQGRYLKATYSYRGGWDLRDYIH